MELIKNLYTKYREIINYLIFGVLTTVVNITTFYLLTKMSVEWELSNMIAWITSVMFAYVTNKLYVFQSKKQRIISEMITFVSFRIVSLGIDMLWMYAFITLWNINELFSKIVVNIIVVIVNYVFSKVFIFKKEEDHK